MVNAWTDGLVSLVMTVTWGIQQLLISIISSNKLKRYMLRYVILHIVFTTITVLTGVCYVIVAVIDGNPNDFYAQASLTLLTGIIVALAVERPPWTKMLKNGRQIDYLLSRQKYKIGDRRFLANVILPKESKCILKIVRNVPSGAKKTTQNYGGPVYTLNERGYVYINFNESDLFGLNPKDINVLFTGYDTFTDIKILAYIELSWFPSNLINFSKEHMNLCSFLSNEGAYTSLKNWKSIAAEVPTWVLPLATDVQTHYKVTQKPKPNDIDYIIKNINNQIKPDLVDITSKINIESGQYTANFAVSIIMILNSENINILKDAVQLLTKYFEQCFFDNQQIDQSLINDKLWYIIADSFISVESLP
jgi:hypothetical protein